MFLDFDFDKEGQLTDSKFFGEIALPSNLIEKGFFGSDELFVCQINLSQLNEKMPLNFLPKSGVMCFFIDFKKKPFKGIVRLFNLDELDGFTTFNEDFDCFENVIDEILVEFTEEETYCQCFFDYDNDKFCLLKVEYFADEPILPIYSTVYFLIDKTNLKNCDFSKIELKIE